MKRILIFAAVLLLSLGCARALADGQINPYYAETRPVRRPAALTAPQTRGLTLSVEMPGGVQTGEPVTFTAAASSEGVTYYFHVLSLLSDSLYQYSYYDRSGSESGQFTYTFRYPGDYWLMVTADNGSGSVRYDGFFSVTGEDYLAQKVAEVVAACPGGGDYETALWLHDYLTSHAYYDGTYSRYTADGVLIDGFGVCDSYSKAYELLLSAAGISSQRVLSESHSWNAVSMEGAWYNVDVTWDDPGRAAVAVSGSEHHDYFGLPNSIMFRVSEHEPSESGYPDCTALDCNYAVRTGRMPWHDAVVQSILENLEAYESRFRIELSRTYPLDENWNSVIDEPILPYGLSSLVLEAEGVQFRGRAVTIAADYDPDEDEWGMTLEAHYALSGGDRLVVKAAEIGEEAFYGAGASVVVIAGGCERLEAATFADMSALDEVHIPASVTEIEDTAFSGCPENLLIVTAADSCAAQFAMDNAFCLEIETEAGE